MTGSEVEFNLAQGLTIESPMERHTTTLRNERSGIDPEPQFALR
jgi:hypothetical protein